MRHSRPTRGIVAAVSGALLMIGCSAGEPEALVEAGPFRFAPRGPIPTGNHPTSAAAPGPPSLTLRDPSTIATADLDGDGRRELLGGRFLPGEIDHVHAGPGGFAVDATCAGPDGTAALAADDLDGDGRPELAIAGARADDLLILGPDLTPRTTAPAPTWPSHVLVADLDGDGGVPEVIVPGNLGAEVA